ncbi:MAG: transporter substrate-binding domain-containing protein, partial [Myxococcota bacterium]
RKTPLLALVQGTTLQASPILDKLKTKTQNFLNYKEILHAMEHKKIDYVVADLPIALHMLRSVTQAYKMHSSLGQQEEYAIGLHRKSKQLQTIVNRALEELAKAGTLAYLQRQWL